MSFILKSHRDRYRQRARENIYRTLLIVGCVIAAITVGYIAGQKYQAQRIRYLESQSERTISDMMSNEQEMTTLRADLQTLRIKHQQLTQDYNRDVPKGDLGLLTSLLREQLDKGLAVERLAQIIRLAQPPQNCTQPVSKRFILPTPVYKGPDSAITFADGAITVTGIGEPSMNSNNEKEAWFDPGKPVQITFMSIGGKKDVKEGLLPLNHTIILRGKEHRFTIAEGPRSFLVITSDYCDYPEEMLADDQQ